MTLALALVVIIGIGLPVAAAWLSRHVRPVRQPLGGPGPRFDRIDRWLFERYRLGALDRWHVKQAVLTGNELPEPALRQAAHGLAVAMLAGNVGGFISRLGWVLIAEGAFIVVMVVVASVISGDYVVLVGIWGAVPLLAIGTMAQKGARQRIERARRLNH
jgi:hypothetical protein